MSFKYTRGGYLRNDCVNDSQNDKLLNKTVKSKTLCKGLNLLLSYVYVYLTVLYYLHFLTIEDYIH
jgi:hypothetical protein